MHRVAWPEELRGFLDEGFYGLCLRKNGFNEILAWRRAGRRGGGVGQLLVALRSV